jgi:formylglycine-generating enzyme required for sulfatase activity
VLDLAGNVWEWTAHGGVRGGSYIHGPGQIRCSARHPLRADVVDPYVGFRVAAGPDDHAREPLLGWADVPAGDVLLGNDPLPPGGPALAEETPAHEVELAPFEIGAVPVTNAEWEAFAAATGRVTPDGPDDHPVAYVGWHEAVAFCAWAGVRLPTEAEWERAARGPDGRLYPWGGEQPGPTRAVFGRGTKADATAPVGACPAGASAEGVLDLAGNVWEWTSSAYRPYPYRAGDGREDAASGEQRVLRGGSFASPGALWLRCASRSSSYPARRRGHIGFRVARS